MPMSRVLGIAGISIVKWLGLGVIAILCSGLAYLYHDVQISRINNEMQVLNTELIVLRKNRDEWRTASDSCQTKAEGLVKEREVARSAQIRLQQQLRQQSGAYELLRQQVRAAPDADDAAVAPVLRNAIEALP